MANEIINIESSSENDDLKIKNKNGLFSERFYFSEIFDEKRYKKFIKNVEKTIRSSNEYDDYIMKVRSSISALNCDNILSNITNLDVDLEFHHYPFTLYDIVDIVCSHNLVNKKKFTSLSLAKEIMNLHYKNYIGLVPLSKTTHELAHNGRLFFSKKQIFGQYEKLIEIYPDGISVEMKTNLKKLDENTNKGIPSDWSGVFK